MNWSPISVLRRAWARHFVRSEGLADSAYINADHCIAARERHSIDLAGPGRRNLGWQNRAEGAFGLTDLAMDRDRRVAHCPEGKESAGRLEASERPGRRSVIRVRSGPSTAGPARHGLAAPDRGRAITIACWRSARGGSHLPVIA